MGKCFPCRVNEKVAVSAEIKLRLSLHEKTSPTYIENFTGDTQQQNFLYRKEILSANVRKKKKYLRNVGRKTAVGGYLTTDVGYCFLLFNP